MSAAGATSLLTRHRGSRRFCLGALAMMSAALWWIFIRDLVRGGEFIVPVFVLAIVTLATAALVASRLRWMPALGALVAGVILYQAAGEPFVRLRLTHPETLSLFIANLLMLCSGAVAVISGITASARSLRRGH